MPYRRKRKKYAKWLVLWVVIFIGWMVLVWYITSIQTAPLFTE